MRYLTLLVLVCSGCIIQEQSGWDASAGGTDSGTDSAGTDGTNASGSATSQGSDSGDSNSASTTSDDSNGSESASTTSAGTTTGSGPSTTTDDSSTAATNEATYPATVAFCVDDQVLDPDACAGTFGGLAVQRGDDGQPDYNSYMAFELGGEFAGETVGEVILRVRATDDPQAGGSNSGTVWEVESFTEGGIMSGEPSTVGTSLLGEYAPSFSSGETIDIQLLPSAIEADATFYLSIRGGSENSAVIYDDLTGPSPPQLIVRW